MASILTLTQWESRLFQEFSSAESYRSTHDEQNKRIAECVHAELKRMHGKRRVYPAFVQGYVFGLLAAHRAAQWSKMEFCYVENGVLFSTHRESVHRNTEEFYASGRGSELGKLPCAHFWKGTDKPFTPIRPIGENTQ